MMKYAKTRLAMRIIAGLADPYEHWSVFLHEPRPDVIADGLLGLEEREKMGNVVREACCGFVSDLLMG